MAEFAGEVVGGRVPPHNLQAEEAALSACLGSESALEIVIALLKEGDFYKPAHRTVFSAVVELHTNQSPVDIITVSDLLSKRNELAGIGGASFLSYLADLPVLRANAAEYAGIVRQKAMLRHLIASLDEVIKLSFSGEDEANNLVDLAIKRLSDMRENPTGGGFEKVYDILSRTIQEINDITKGKVEQKAVRTGFERLDKALGGLKPGTLTVVAARPGMGKSAFVINIATNSSIFYSTPVAFFSLEMSKKEIGNRILAARSEVSTDALQNAKVTNEDFDKIGEAVSHLAAAPFYIDDRSGINPVEMLAKCRQMKNTGQLGLIIIDYLQLMTAAGGRSSGNRQQEISDISRSLKIMAKELDVPVIALSQLSRGAEYREDRRPILADLRDSGAIEQDADAVLFIYRDKYYENSADRLPIEDAEIIIAKNRQGPMHTVHLKWWAARTLFIEPEDSRFAREAPTGAGRYAEPPPEYVRDFEASVPAGFPDAVSNSAANESAFPVVDVDAMPVPDFGDDSVFYDSGVGGSPETEVF